MKDMHEIKNVKSRTCFSHNHHLETLETKFTLNKVSFTAPLTFLQRTILHIQKSFLIFFQLHTLQIYYRTSTPDNILYLVLQHLQQNNLVHHSEIIFEDRYNDLPNLPIARVVGNVDVLHQESDGVAVPFISGENIGFDQASASTKAVGEFLERYALASYKNNSLLTSCCHHMKHKSFIHPRHFASFSSEQIATNKKYQWDEHTPFQWIKVRSLVTGKKTWAPAQAVFWNYKPLDNEALIMHSTSNGGGGHTVYHKAVLGGLLEAIERDGFLLHWLSGTPPPQISLRSLRKTKVNKLLSLLERYRLQVKVFDTTTDLGIPSYVAAVFDPTGIGPMVSFGGSARLDPVDAIEKALFEAYDLHIWLRRKMEKDEFVLPEDYQPFSLPIGRSSRLLLWSNTRMKKDLEFFLAGNEIDLDDLSYPISRIVNTSTQHKLNAIIDTLVSKGPEFETYVYNVNNKILRPLNYNVTKVIVPGLLPLYLREDRAPLGAKRLHEFCEQKHGKQYTIQPLPHPFP